MLPTMDEYRRCREYLLSRPPCMKRCRHRVKGRCMILKKVEEECAFWEKRDGE